MVLTKPRTDALQHEYETDGYVTLRGVISTEDQVGFCSMMRAMVEAKAQSRNIAPDTEKDAFDWVQRRLPEVDALDHEIIKLAYETSSSTLAAKRLFWNPAIVDVCATLLGCNSMNLFLYSDRIRIDPPEPQPFRLGWHQESAYGPSESPGVQIWGPLLWPSSWSNGSIQIALTSHRLGHVTWHDKGQQTGGALQFIVPDEIVQQFEIKLVEIESGDLIVFSPNLIHRSSDPSRQQQMKLSITGRYLNTSSPHFRPYDHHPR